MQFKENLTLVQVDKEEKSVDLLFLDIEGDGCLYPVRFNKQSYDAEKGKFVDDPEKAEKVEEWCQQYFGLTFDTIGNAVDVKKDVYCYDKYNSLWESDSIAKFEKTDKGKIFTTEIKDIIDDGTCIKIRFDHNNNTYESNMRYSRWLEERKMFVVEPILKTKKYEQFEKKFGVSVDDKDEIIGKEIMVEVQIAFNKFPYCEIKNPSWAE